MPETAGRRSRSRPLKSSSRTESYYVGISGWRYAGWRKTFYPKDLTQKKELEYASHRLPTIEINGSFYSLQSPRSYREWYRTTPRNFVFSVKGPRYITHIRRLKDARQPLATFFASGVLSLKEKLGPVLWQLPPNFKYDPERLEPFLKLLPRTTGAARALAIRYADRSKLKHGFSAAIDRDRRLRHALEVRNPSFEGHPEFIRLLKKYRVALVSTDAAKDWPYFESNTSDFAYARLHGGRVMYASGYGPLELRKWARRARQWHRQTRGKVFIYFDNDAKVRAPFDASKLQHLLH